MSSRLQPAANEAARLVQPTRRLLLGGASASLVRDSVFANADLAVRASAIWLARHAEHDRLGQRWQEIEDRLFKERNWSRLTRAERNRFPEKLEMDALYDRMDALHDENFALLSSLSKIAATTHGGICGKLAVVACELCPEDHPEAHELIDSILRDYRALHRV